MTKSRLDFKSYQSNLLMLDALAKEDTISTRKGGQHQKEKHQVKHQVINMCYTGKM